MALSASVPWWVFASALALPYVWFGFFLGATFWIDGFCYAGLGSALSDPTAYREFNTGFGRLSLSHLQVGLPALAWLLNFLPDPLQWPVFETLQRLVSFASLVFTLGVLSDGKPKVVHLLAGLLVAWNPFFQAFHNAFMTESLSGSLLLCGFALSLWMFRSGRIGWIMIAALVMAVFFVTQFRSYYGALILAMGIAAMWLGRLRGRALGTTILIAGAAVSVFFYPACRWVAIGDWFLPGAGVNKLLVAVYLNPNPGPEIAKKIRTFSSEERKAMRSILTAKRPFLAEDAKKLVLLMLQSGMTEREIDAKLQNLGSAILTERPDLIAKRVRHGLASSGLLETSCLWMDGVEMYRGMAPEDYRRHLRSVLDWHSWLSGEDYRASFASFFATPRDTFPATAAGQEWLRRTQETYVRAPTARWMRDPLGLGFLPPDIWAWAGILSAIVLIARSNIVGVLVLGAVAANFLVAFAVPVGNPRYSYGVFPLYLLALGAFVAIGLRLPEAPGLQFSLRALLADGWRIFLRRT